MNYKIQLISFLVSFLFGIFFFYTNMLNKKIINKQKIYYKYIITFLYIINITLIYIILIYKINKGIFHIYFLIMVLLGYIISLNQLKNVKKCVKWMKSHIKVRKKML